MAGDYTAELRNKNKTSPASDRTLQVCVYIDNANSSCNLFMLLGWGDG